jgi:Ca2+-binding EF-hand superfamily protein
MDPLKKSKASFWSASNEEKIAQSPWEVLKTQPITSIEQECLDRVFNHLCSQDPKKGEEFKRKIGPTDLMKKLTDLGLKLLRSEVALYIWEVDDDLDGYISKDEFQIMYKRCRYDKSGLEPRKLYNLTQFLMYDKSNRGRVTVEETLQILFIRHGRDRLDYEIEAIFGQDEKNTDGTEKSISFGEYLEKVNSRAIKEHFEKMKALKSVDKPEKDLD